ncbi:hypothetical protein [Phyllobacterium sp. SB3]|uniref:hypothetical protein n=1 Tax=Phyllobacterium sp. SB3 TaxID=3156073 RepID=UPI0032AFB1D2
MTDLLKHEGQRSRLHAIAADGSGYPDDVMDSLMGTIYQLEDIIVDTPANSMADIIAKLRLAMSYAVDDDGLRTGSVEFLHSIADDWQRVLLQDFAMSMTEARASEAGPN